MEIVLRGNKNFWAIDVPGRTGIYKYLYDRYKKGGLPDQYNNYPQTELF